MSKFLMMLGCGLLSSTALGGGQENFVCNHTGGLNGFFVGFFGGEGEAGQLREFHTSLDRYSFDYHLNQDLVLRGIDQKSAAEIEIRIEQFSNATAKQVLKGTYLHNSGTRCGSLQCIRTSSAFLKELSGVGTSTRKNMDWNDFPKMIVEAISKAKDSLLHSSYGACGFSDLSLRQIAGPHFEFRDSSKASGDDRIVTYETTATGFFICE